VETPRDTEPADTASRLTPSVVAKELAKVSAQLGTGDDRNDKSTGDNATPVSTDANGNSRRGTDDTDRAVSRPGTSDLSVVIQPEAIPPKVATTAESTEKSSKEAPAPVFGRSQSRRGDKLRKEKRATDSEPTESPDTHSSYSSQEASFGRGKKKRTR